MAAAFEPFFLRDPVKLDDPFADLAWLREPWQFIAILPGRVPEQRKVPLTWENVGVEANILL